MTSWRCLCNALRAERVLSVRTNTHARRLERAVVQLPATEKMIFLMHDVERYEHARIANLLGIAEDVGATACTRRGSAFASCWRNRFRLLSYLTLSLFLNVPPLARGAFFLEGSS